MRFQTWLGALAATLALACGPSSRDIQEIRDMLQQMSAKLESIDQTLAPLRAAAQAQPPGEDFNKVYDIQVGDSPIKGDPNAPVTLVEYSDFECPYCARADPGLKELAAKYPQKLRVVFKHYPLPFHEKARPLAIASMAAQEQGRVGEFHDAVFKGTSSNSLESSDAAIEGYAKQAGLDVERFKRDRKEKAADYDKRVEQDIAQGNSVDVRGTPTLFINGKKVQARSVEGMSKMVESASGAPTGG
jgi:protein-disulfide isomerase